jgi:hypothetical protein
LKRVAFAGVAHFDTSAYYLCMAFYVSHMTPHKRARIHKGSCVHCNNGLGQKNQAKSDSGATGWSPPQATLAEAEAYMERAFPRFIDKGKCSHCKPGID